MSMKHVCYESTKSEKSGLEKIMKCQRKSGCKSSSKLARDFVEDFSNCGINWRTWPLNHFMKFLHWYYPRTFPNETQKYVFEYFITHLHKKWDSKNMSLNILSRTYTKNETAKICLWIFYYELKQNSRLFKNMTMNILSHTYTKTEIAKYVFEYFITHLH